MKPALLVVDVQNQFFEISPETKASLNKAVHFINEALVFFREKKLPIIVIQHIDETNGLVPGTPGFELPESLNILPTDQRIHKTYGNAFNKTELETVLHELGVDTVIISGFCAEYCILSTYRGALDRDFTPALLRWTLASVNTANIPFIESINDTISLKLLKKALD
ncbi:MAG: isochorismatase family cysteine hydrolase [Sporomusaceae bacterium]|nr:isochorismatase family cysteine hydrolase [Sporomusaceae bacterium]